MSEWQAQLIHHAAGNSQSMDGSGAHVSCHVFAVRLFPTTQDQISVLLRRCVQCTHLRMGGVCTHPPPWEPWVGRGSPWLHSLVQGGAQTETSLSPLPPHGVARLGSLPDPDSIVLSSHSGSHCTWRDRIGGIIRAPGLGRLCGEDARVRRGASHRGASPRPHVCIDSGAYEPQNTPVTACCSKLLRASS